MDDLTKQVVDIYGQRITAYALGFTSALMLENELTDLNRQVLDAMLEFYTVSNSRNSDKPEAGMTRSLILGCNFWDKRLGDDYHAPLAYLHEVSLGNFADSTDDPRKIIGSAENWINDVWL